MDCQRPNIIGPLIRKTSCNPRKHVPVVDLQPKKVYHWKANQPVPSYSKMHQNNPVPVTTHGPTGQETMRDHHRPPTAPERRSCRTSEPQPALGSGHAKWEVASGSPSLWMGQRNPRNHQFGWLKPYKSWDVYICLPSINWCRISQPSTVGVPFLLNSYHVVFPLSQFVSASTAPCSADYAPLRLTERNNYDAHGKNQTQFKNYMIWYDRVNKKNKRLFPIGITT